MVQELSREEFEAFARQRAAAVPEELRPLMKQLMEIRAEQLERARQALASDRSAKALLAIAAEATSLADNLCAEYGKDQKVACKPGCSWCCHIQVVVSVPEVALIAHHLKGLGKNRYRDLTTRLARADQRTRGLSGMERQDARIACPFLIDERCAIYAVRPIRCRAYHSLSASACAAFYRAPRAVGIPQSDGRLYVGHAIAEGLEYGLQQAGLPVGILELNAALRLVLSVPGALAAWLGSGDVFAPALLPTLRAVHL